MAKSKSQNSTKDEDAQLDLRQGLGKMLSCSPLSHI